MANLLCPQLYKRLQARFATVTVANSGEALVGRVRRRVCSTGIKPVFDIVSPGEYYRVSCPYCPDTRQRLWVNHMFGQPDPADTRRTLNWLAVCYNEGCLTEWARRIQLEDLLFGACNRTARATQFAVSRGTVDVGVLRETRLPGQVIRLDELSYDHMACQYLLARGFDPVRLAREYGVVFCVDADAMYPAASQRIIVPIYMHGKLVGWQGRWPADLDWKSQGIPKYYGLPHMPKRLMLYNYDNAKAFDVCIVVEGVTDVWATGDPAVALLGNRIHPMQRKLLLEFTGGIVIMLDPGVVVTEEDLNVFRRQFEGRVATVALPDGVDPGELSEGELWNRIADVAVPAGIDISKVWIR